MDHTNELLSQKDIFLNFMKEKYPVHNNSNIFLRDIQYAVKSFLEKKNKKVKFAETAKITEVFIEQLSEKGILKKISANSWKLNFSLEKNVIQENEENQVQK